MSGCGVPPYMAVAGGPWALLRLKKKNKMRAAAETATTPPVTPPAMAPTLEEEPLELDEVDEVEVWEDEMEEEAEAVTREDGATEDGDVQVPESIIAPGGTSGKSKNGSVLIKHDRMTEKGGCSYHQ